MSLKGSFTIEASIIIPTFIIILAIGMKMAILLYQEITTEYEQQIVEEMWLVDDFYKYEIVEEVINE